ncbi:MAG: methyltransferase domain-containing protein [Campylobacteraceae bacterium]|nr:methyltransferase domain-containing protein [Campylobacteraceae bacterium]
MQNGINRYIKILLEQNKAEVLAIALNLKLFDYLEKDIMNLDLLVKELSTHSKNTNTLLEALFMIDLIYKKDGFYKNTEITKKYFISYLSTYCGNVFLHRKDMLNHGRKAMAELVSNGPEDVTMTKSPKKWASVSKKFLKQEQTTLISQSVVKIVKSLKEYPNMTKILDLGCASGVLGLEIVKSQPNIKAVLFDFPDVTSLIPSHIDEYNLANRVSILSGDMQNDDIGSNYDLIWCSNIFYFLDNKTDLIKKIYKALSPNGILISAHVEIGDEVKVYEDSLFYFLGLNLQGRTMFKPMELSTIFEDIGFRNINSYTTSSFPMTPTQIHIAKK